MKSFFFLLIISVLASGCATALRDPSSFRAQTNVTLSEEESQALALINALRAKFNLQALVIDSSLQRAAQVHSEYMSSQRVYDHTEKSPTPEFDDRIHAAHGKFANMGENINCASTAVNAVGSWENSSEHREAILSPEYQSIGISYHGTGEKILGVRGCTRNAFWTAVFGGN